MSADNLREFILPAGEATPDKPALIEAGEAGPRVLTFRDLRRRVEEYTRELDALGLDVGDRVILESTTTGEAVAAFLACCALGLPFIPTSPDTPDKRLQTIIGIAEPALFLQGAHGTREGLPDGMGTGRFGEGGLTVERSPLPRTRYRRTVVATDPAYIIFTSGTTGVPKGVVMSHRANIAFHAGFQAEGVVRPDDRVAIAAPFHFDLCLGGIALALSTGATAIPVPKDRLDWPRRFAAFLTETEATQVQGVPSIWRALMRHEPGLLSDLDRLRVIVFSGEDFPLPELRELQRLLPGRRIVNCYGATESMAASVMEVPDPIPDTLERLSIGFAHPGAEMSIFDEERRPVITPGAGGEIYLRGPTLFTGYWGNPEATDMALVPDPLNPASGQRVFRTGDLATLGEQGELYFYDRADSQVQIRGNRVELGEVERRMLELPGIAAAAAVLRPGGAGEDELCVFVVAKPGAAELDLVTVRAFCLETLPSYMAPARLRVLAELPVTANGKVDRGVLAAY